MHYTINYDKLEPVEKHNAAINDIKDYMGMERFEKIVASFKDRYPTAPAFEAFKLILSFAGVQGYPAKAMYNYIWGL